MLLRLRDPYSRIRDGDVDRALRKLSRQLGAPPHPFEYSNFGYGVLSRALAAAGGAPFGVLLHQEVLAPLNLEDVSLETGPDPDRQRLFGHNDAGAEMEHWRNPALPGAPLELVHQARLPAGPGMEVALGWLVRGTDQGPVHWHNGGTAGFGSFIGLDLPRRTGVAVLISRRHDQELDDAAMRAISELRAGGNDP
jgi:CubicO group peptidase (beta-lactamase class C family)